MSLRLILLLLSLSLSLPACAPPPAPPQVPAAPVLDVAALRLEAGALPGVVIGAGEPLRLEYPGEILFAAGAALPLPGGTALLDPLAEFLLTHPEVSWTGTLRAETGISPEYDAALAEKRRELLERYFRNKGIAAERLKLSATAGAGAPFELVLLAPAQSMATSPASSSGVKP